MVNKHPHIFSALITLVAALISASPSAAEEKAHPDTYRLYERMQLHPWLRPDSGRALQPDSPVTDVSPAGNRIVPPGILPSTQPEKSEQPEQKRPLTQNHPTDTMKPAGHSTDSCTKSVFSTCNRSNEIMAGAGAWGDGTMWFSSALRWYPVPVVGGGAALDVQYSRHEAVARLKEQKIDSREEAVEQAASAGWQVTPFFQLNFMVPFTRRLAVDLAVGLDMLSSVLGLGVTVSTLITAAGGGNVSRDDLRSPGTGYAGYVVRFSPSIRYRLPGVILSMGYNHTDRAREGAFGSAGESQAWSAAVSRFF